MSHVYLIDCLLVSFIEKTTTTQYLFPHIDPSESRQQFHIPRYRRQYNAT
jgi:hypothetical protein